MELNPKDVEETTYRASGAGGQHRNKTDSAVRVKHIPTGLICTAEESRSQDQNRKTAWGRLRQTLEEKARTQAHQDTNQNRLEQIQGSRGWTWNEKAGKVTRQADGKSWSVEKFAAMKADLL